MNTKGSQNSTTTNLATIPAEDTVVYVAIKGSLHAQDCSAFGLGEEEIKALSKKFPGSRVDVVNGVTIKTNVLEVMNSLSQLGYRVVGSTGETEITWTLQPYNGDTERVQSIINKARNVKEAVNAPDNTGYTALHYAARTGQMDVCKILLSNGADVNATTNGNATPLHKAAAAGKLAIVKFLIQSGARIDAQDIDGQTVLHKAVDNKYNELAKFLLDLCPKLVQIKDVKGRLPMDPAIA